MLGPCYIIISREGSRTHLIVALTSLYTMISRLDGFLMHDFSHIL